MSAFLRHLLLWWCAHLGFGVSSGYDGAAPSQSDARLLLELVLERVRQRTPGGVQGACALDGAGGPHVFLIRTERSDSAMTASDFSVLESVLFNHPLAKVFVLALDPLDEAIFDGYLREGYCVALVQLQMSWLQSALAAAEPALSQQQFQAIAADRRGLPFLLNCAVLAVQILYGGLSLAMDGLLLNPFDTLLPSALQMNHTAVFVERVLGPEEAAPQVALEREDFERSWMPRSHTDRSDRRTLVCGDSLCPRAVPQGSPLGRQLLRAWLESYLRQGQVPNSDLDATRLYSSYVRARPVLAEGHALGYEAVVLPGWVIVESHFPDGWRRYGHRGQIDEREDRMHFHSQLYTPRSHRERSDWSLVRSLKLWLPLGYGPPSARNILPRSIVDLARRFLSLGIAPYDLGPLQFGKATPSVVRSEGHRLHTPMDIFEALSNPMAESLGLGERPRLSREVALPGGMGGFRTFRDVRVAGLGCEEAEVRLTARLGTGGLSCRPAARPEAQRAPEDLAAWRACLAGLREGEAGFELAAPPALLNAALALLAYRPLRGLGRAPEAAEDGRLSAEELAAHFTDLRLELTTVCAGGSAAVVADLRALLDDVEEQVTVVAHSASRCDLLDRLRFGPLE